MIANPFVLHEYGWIWITYGRSIPRSDHAGNCASEKLLAILRLDLLHNLGSVDFRSNLVERARTLNGDTSPKEF